MSVATITMDHDEIRAWVEERGGYPARVRASDGRQGTLVIRVDFPSLCGDRELERLTWEEWFRAFDEFALAFVHQDETEDGKISHFNHLVPRESVESGLRRSAL